MTRPGRIEQIFDGWPIAVGPTAGSVFRRVSRLKRRHDLRRACVRLCHVAGGEREQIQLLVFLRGQVSIRTMEQDRRRPSLAALYGPR